MSSTNKTTYYDLPQFVDNDLFNPLVDDNDAYSKIDTALHEIAGAEANNANEITSVKGRVTEIEGKVTALETQNGTEVLATTAQTLSGAVNELDSGVNSLDGRLDVVEDDINNSNTGLKVKVADLVSRMTTAEGDIDTLEAQNGDETLTTTAQTLSGAVNELDSDVNTLNNLKAYITPEQFGAIGDGVTDDTVAINSMLANASGKIVVFTKKYLVDGSYDGSDFHLMGLQVKSNTTIVFASDSQIQMKTANSEYASIFTIIDAENVDIYGGTIIGDYDTHVIVGTTDEWCHGFTIYGSKNVHIHGMTIKNCFGDGIYAGQYPYHGGDRPTDNHCKNITINNVIIDKAGRNGVAIGDCDGWLLSNLVITNVDRTNPKSAIDIEQEGNYTPFISDGKIEHVITSDCTKGISVTALTGSIVTIDDCVCDPIDTGANTSANNEFTINIVNCHCNILIWQTRVKISNCVIPVLTSARETGLDSEAFEMHDCFIMNATGSDPYLAIHNNVKAVNCRFKHSIVVSGKYADFINCIFDHDDERQSIITVAGTLNEKCRVIGCTFKNVNSSTARAFWDATPSSVTKHKSYVENCECETDLTASLGADTWLTYCTEHMIVVNGNSYFPFEKDAVPARLVTGCVNFNY